jgi:prepilin-type N-terminal cleavage/methylation domain-containing protein
MYNGAMKKSGFTLVELSIVLVIIGLIVGGVVGGQSLIASARISTQVQQLTQYETAYRAFQLQYDAIPGDMVDASDYWPGATNGDGNNRITHNADYAYLINAENIKFFEHLSRAGVVSESYTNVWSLGEGYPALGLDDGKGMIAAGFVRSDNIERLQLSGAAGYKPHIAALYLNVANPSVSDSTYNDGAGVMTSAQAKNIDKKIDDGAARTGRYQSHRAYNSTQGDCLDGVDGDYLLSNDQAACMGAYILE